VGVTNTPLHKLERGAKIYSPLMGMIGKVFFESDSEKDPIIFDHIDGMYSYCYLQSKPEMVVHLNASTPLVPYKDGWKIQDVELERENGSDKRHNADAA